MNLANFDKDILKWIWFAQATVPGSSYAAKILKHGDDINDIYGKEYEYSDFNVPEYVIDSLNEKNLDEAERIAEYCEEHDILPVHIFDKRFPPKLRDIQDHPALLYMKGTIPDFKNYVLIAVVGTRKCTQYGLETAYEMCDGIARSGIIIVSGMAEGIDAAAATAALNANKFTIAVLGCGVDVIYPKENESLYYQIRNHGLLISEYPPLAEGSKLTFPERNRLMSGMSDGVFVIEADQNSGALITADRALYQGRKIYAVPGNVDSPQSVGTNRLIQNGAKLIIDANDIIAEHQHDALHELVPVMKRDVERIKREKDERNNKRKNIKKSFFASIGSKIAKESHNSTPNAVSKDKPTTDKKQPELLSNKEKVVYNCLSDAPKGTDQIAKEISMSISETSAMLTMLTIKEMVEHLPGDRYIRIKKGR